MWSAKRRMLYAELGEHNMQEDAFGQEVMGPDCRLHGLRYAHKEQRRVQQQIILLI